MTKTDSARPWPCPYCRARANERCRHGNGWQMAKPHGSRLDPPKRWRNFDPIPVDEQSERAIRILPKNVWSRIEFTAHCWTWRGAANGKGYGSVGHEGRTWSTHKLVYELLVGPVSEGLQIDHLCLNKRCCNPDHLEPVTPKQNANRYHIAKYGCASGRETDDPTYAPRRAS
jgi:HNH endonuclease